MRTISGSRFTHHIIVRTDLCTAPCVPSAHITRTIARISVLTLNRTTPNIREPFRPLHDLHGRGERRRGKRERWGEEGRGGEMGRRYKVWLKFVNFLFPPRDERAKLASSEPSRKLAHYPIHTRDGWVGKNYTTQFFPSRFVSGFVVVVC